MKVLFVTDIHDALKELRELLQVTEADLYLLCGDILYHAFYDEDKIYQFVCLQEEFYSYAATREEKIFPYDLATNILRHPETVDAKEREDWLIKAAEYRVLFHKAGKTMKEKYLLIEDLVRKYTNAECALLPGNYDLDLRYTSLSQRDLHQKEFRQNNIHFAGYGGAPIATSGIPEKLVITYHESTEDGVLFSEPEDFFLSCNPDVMVLHNPAYGYFDRVPTMGHVGSPGIRNYIDQHNPGLVVSGHVHEDYGMALKKNGTLLLNPSNFGGVDSPYGYQPGGVFAEIEINDATKKVEGVTIKRLVNREIHELLHADIHGEKLIPKKLKDADKSHLDLQAMIRDHAGNRIQW